MLWGLASARTDLRVGLFFFRIKIGDAVDDGFVLEIEGFSDGGGGGHVMDGGLARDEGRDSEMVGAVKGEVGFAAFFIEGVGVDAEV